MAISLSDAWHTPRSELRISGLLCQLWTARHPSRVTLACNPDLALYVTARLGADGAGINQNGCFQAQRATVTSPFGPRVTRNGGVLPFQHSCLFNIMDVMRLTIQSVFGARPRGPSDERGPTGGIPSRDGGSLTSWSPHNPHPIFRQSEPTQSKRVSAECRLSFGHKKFLPNFRDILGVA